MSAAKKKRRVWRVSWSERNRLWRSVSPRGGVAWFATKREAVVDGRSCARSERPSQLMIHNRDGKIQTEHTYGSDPRRFKG